MKLHLGCSDDLKPGWLNVDIGPAPAGSRASRVGNLISPIMVTPSEHCYQQADLNAPWPWEDGSVDSILANDVLEHLSTKIWAMNEAHRVLKPGGILSFTVPAVCLSDGRVNVGAFADPTHRTFWTIDDCFYFGEQWNTPDMERGRLGPAYGITALFRFPPMWEQKCSRVYAYEIDIDGRSTPKLMQFIAWRTDPSYKGHLAWKLEEANERAKIRAILEAIK